MLKEQAILLRKQGKTYSEIQKILSKFIPKSTLSYWCKNIPLTDEQKKKIQTAIINNINQARQVAIKVNKLKREKYLFSVANRVEHLRNTIQNKDVAKIALAMLYLGEGSKGNQGALMFGNSSPLIIRLFFNLLRHCYIIDESKFRCTLQCRADQNIMELERFWSETTKIPLSQFYKARIDPRTINKPSKKKDYKGVCRIDYFSADLYNELIKIIEAVDSGATKI